MPVRMPSGVGPRTWSTTDSGDGRRFDDTAATYRAGCAPATSSGTCPRPRRRVRLHVDRRVDRRVATVAAFANGSTCVSRVRSADRRPRRRAGRESSQDCVRVSDRRPATKPRSRRGVPTSGQRRLRDPTMPDPPTATETARGRSPSESRRMFVRERARMFGYFAQRLDRALVLEDRIMPWSAVPHGDTDSNHQRDDPDNDHKSLLRAWRTKPADPAKPTRRVLLGVIAQTARLDHPRM